MPKDKKNVSAAAEVPAVPVCEKCEKPKYHHSTVGDVKFYRCKTCKTPLIPA